MRNNHQKVVSKLPFMFKYLKSSEAESVCRNSTQPNDPFVCESKSVLIPDLLFCFLATTVLGSVSLPVPAPDQSDVEILSAFLGTALGVELLLQNR